MSDEIQKERITIRLDKDVLKHFRGISSKTKAPYQTLINDALRKHIEMQVAIDNFNAAHAKGE